jgi:predicted Co/Zn/Cd cation transporter (cation efflux family)
VITICAATIITSIQDLLHADPMTNLRLAVWYSFISIFICAGFGFYMKRVGIKVSSQVLQADSQLWMIEGLISAAVFVAFAAGLVISKTIWKEYTHYIDPVLCILVSLVLVYKPIRLVGEGFKDLVDECPGGGIGQKIRTLANHSKEKYKLTDLDWFKIRKAGRRLFVVMCFVADPNKSLKELETVRTNIIGDVSSAVPEIDVYVFFTYRSMKHNGLTGLFFKK